MGCVAPDDVLWLRLLYSRSTCETATRLKSFPSIAGANIIVEGITPPDQSRAVLGFTIISDNTETIASNVTVTLDIIVGH